MPRSRKRSAAEDFSAAFGPGEQYRPYTEADATRLGERLPDVMKTILRNDGWCSYKDQVIWLCDPDDWSAAARSWMPQSESAQVLGRTAFGDLFIHDGEMFWFAMVHEALLMMAVADADWFFSRTISAHDFAPQTYLPERVKAARAAAGALEWNELYTYVPALVLGGSVETSRIERVQALEALVMLAQLAPIRRV
jgi:hypothetical protein